MFKKYNKAVLKIAKRIVNYEDQLRELEVLRAEYNKEKEFGWPSGHFYSPNHNLEDLKPYEDIVKRSQDIFAKSIPGFSDKRMLKEFNKLKIYFSEFDYPVEDDGDCRFYINNSSYPIGDALVLFAMIRSNKPKRIIEIGSGFTSALMMDVNERFFNNRIDITFIEPYSELLQQRMRESDKKRYKVIKGGVQFVPVDIFRTLERGDILFIDSTHVSKFNSDVNYELFNILPIINSGVIIHFHDVFDGFEYPLSWLKKGWAWNEDYMLRAYLMDNDKYEVLIMNDYLSKRYSKLLKDSYPEGESLYGGSLWLKKLK